MSKTKYDTITEAQHAVMDEIKMLAKDKQGYEYIYTSAAFATTMLRPLMIKHGISKFKVKTVHSGRWQNGLGVDYQLTFRYQLTGTKELNEGVTYQDVPVEAAGKVGKSGDKSTFAAQTTGSKYADLDFFNLPMIDDVEEYEETTELLDEMYGDKKPEKKTSKGKVKTEPEEEEEETEAPSSSKDLTYDDGVLDIIEEIFEKGGVEAMEEFVKGDRRKDVKALVKELLANAEPDEEEEEEDEPEEKPKSTRKGRSSKKKDPEPDEEEEEEESEEGVSLDDLDYEDPKVLKALFKQIDIEDDEQVDEIISTSFKDPEALKDFYAACLEKAQEKDFGDEFNEAHFDVLQETFEELAD